MRPLRGELHPESFLSLYEDGGGYLRRILRQWRFQCSPDLRNEQFTPRAVDAGLGKAGAHLSLLWRREERR